MRSVFLINIIFYVCALFLIISCAGGIDKQTLASLEEVEPDLKEAEISGSLDKAMESYQKFLEETPESAMTPEALRRLADLKVEKEYGSFSDDKSVVTESTDSFTPPSDTAQASAATATAALTASDNKQDEKTKEAQSTTDKVIESKDMAIANIDESQKAFEKRTTEKTDIKNTKTTSPVTADKTVAEDLASAGAKEAIELYKGLLIKYPHYVRNDQVLYQLSRAYEEIGEIEKAMEVLNRLVKEYPSSRHIDEAQFRRAEYFFTRKKYLDAEEAYQAVIDFGISSAFYDLALYKQGWAFFKQDLYEEALNDFIALLDYKISIGYDFEQLTDKIERKRIDDTYRVISLSFSYLGGPSEVIKYFETYGTRQYEASIYSHLGEYYLTKRRYADAADSYNAYVERNPLNKVSPHFHIRVIEIYLKGGFPKLVVESKKNFATTYGLRANYWTFFDIGTYPEVVAFLKSNLTDLANHYHALYQNKRLRKYRKENFKEAIHWYREYLSSFPEDPQAPEINFQLAELLLENKDFRDAAQEYERTSYNYDKHKKSSEAGYAAVFAYREYLKKADQSQRNTIKYEIIRSSLKFGEAYPNHKKAPIVLVAATDDLFAIRDFATAIKIGRKVIEKYPNIDPKYIRASWLVVAHSSFELALYADAEKAYSKVLKLTSKNDKERDKLIENLAASIYKQGEQARKLQDHRTAANHFLRVAVAAPTSKIRPTAEYDAAAALISLKDWSKAAEVLERFRKNYPKNKLLPDVTKKLAIVYKEDGRLLLAAAEFERIEKESKDDAVRREALQQAAELYEEAKDTDKALSIYTRYVKYFPKPVEYALEMRNKIANIYKQNNQKKLYTKQLQLIVAIDLRAGKERTDRTRYLAANASLILAQPAIKRFKAVKLTKPFKKNLNKKKKRMKKAIDALTRLVDYEVGAVTAAATYEIAEIYFHFSRALMNSERPDNLTEDQLEQYELVLEEQAYPFEEKAINVHEKNMELLDLGIYNKWIDKSIEKLAILLPARYAKPEEAVQFVETIIPVKKEILPVNDSKTVNPDVPDNEGLDKDNNETEVNSSEAGSQQTSIFLKGRFKLDKNENKSQLISLHYDEVARYEDV